MELEEQLEQEAAEKESLQSRLDDIASIAAPDVIEREERIDLALQEIRDQVMKLQALMVERFRPEAVEP